MRKALGIALLCALCTSHAASAYLLTDGAARAGLDSWAFTGNSVDPSLLWFDGGPADHLYELYGYLGNTTGVVRVTPVNFDALVAIGGSGNTASSQLVLNAAGAAALGLAAGDITLGYDFALDGAARSLAWDVSVGNSGLATLNLVFYAYADFDLEGDFNNDLATGGANGFFLTDAATGFELNIAAAASHYQLAAYPNVQVALDAMQTTGAANLPDTGAPFGPGDFTGALQFDLSVAPASSQGLGILLVPEPATALELGLGLFGLALAGRKRA